jgi:hypothetical protein
MAFEKFVYVGGCVVGVTAIHRVVGVTAIHRIHSSENDEEEYHD